MIVWFFEDKLKRQYADLVQALEQAASNSLMHHKRLGLNTIFDLLRSKPEKEQELLALLVNKLGDPERKVG